MIYVVKCVVNLCYLIGFYVFWFVDEKLVGDKFDFVDVWFMLRNGFVGFFCNDICVVCFCFLFCFFLIIILVFKYYFNFSFGNYVLKIVWDFV